MTYSRLQDKMILRRKLLILRKLTNSKSVKRCAIMMDAFFYIYKLKLKLEALKREYIHLMQHIQNVRVDKVPYMNGFLVRIRCKKEPDTLISILEALEEMGLCVVQSTVICNHFFWMEAIVDAKKHQEQTMGRREVTQALLKAIDRSKPTDTR